MMHKGETAQMVIERLEKALKDAIRLLDHNHLTHKTEELESKEYKLTFDAQCVRCRSERHVGLR